MKKQIHRSLLWLLLLAPPLFWLGCKKDPEPEIIKGHVREYGTNKPIPDAKVNLSVCDGEFGGPISCGLAASTLTDANGYYSFPPHEGVRIANAVKDGYFTDLDSEISILDKPENDIVLFPHAYLKVVVKNESGAYEFVPESNSSGGPRVYLQQGQDTTLSIKVVKGNLEYTYDYGYYPSPNSSGIWLKASKFCSGHDTTSLMITY
jgi:hypothetical protein